MLSRSIIIWLFLIHVHTFLFNFGNCKITKILRNIKILFVQNFFWLYVHSNFMDQSLTFCLPRYNVESDTTKTFQYCKAMHLMQCIYTPNFIQPEIFFSNSINFCVVHSFNVYHLPFRINCNRFKQLWSASLVCT